MGPIQLTLLGVGAIIGTGIFVLTAAAAQKAAIATTGQIPANYVAEKDAKVVQGSQQFFKSAKGPFTVGVYETVANMPATLVYAEPYPQDEMIMIVSGRMTMIPTKGASTILNAGDTVVIPSGWTGQVRVSAKLRVVHAEFAPKS